MSLNRDIFKLHSSDIRFFIFTPLAFPWALSEFKDTNGYYDSKQYFQGRYTEKSFVVKTKPLLCPLMLAIVCFSVSLIDLNMIIS